jgi:large subunit ribosomal protein L4
MEVKVYKKDGSEIGTVALSEAVFGMEPKSELVHQYIINYLANQRQGNSSTKGRSDVAGGGAKPWRQKGTGRARVGTIRSPIWRGGGITFGPAPRSYYNRFPKKMKKLAMKSALSDKAQNERVMIVEDLQLSQIKTREIYDILDKLGLKSRKCLIVDDGKNENLRLSVRNIPRVKYTWAPLANTYDVVDAEVLLLTKAGLQKIEEVLTK